MAASVVTDPAWTLDNQNTSLNGRHVIGTFFQQATAQTASRVQWRDGVIPTIYSNTNIRDMITGQNSPLGMSVLVHPGTSIITRTGQGPYLCPNSAVRTVPLDAADVTNPRIDLIVHQVTDTAIGDGSSQAVVRAITGTPAGSPTVPATPTGAIPLARVAVAANATQVVSANITWVRKSGGILGAVRHLLEGDAFADAGTLPGELRVRSITSGDPFALEYWDGSGTPTWRGISPTTFDTVIGPASSILGINLTNTIVISQTIPDPGYPYRIYASGVCGYDSDNNAIGDTTLRLTNASGPILGLKGYDPLYTPYGTASGLNRDRQSNMPTRSSGVVTGSQTVCLCLVRAGGGSQLGATANASSLTVQIVPA